MLSTQALAARRLGGNVGISSCARFNSPTALCRALIANLAVVLCIVGGRGFGTLCCGSAGSQLLPGKVAQSAGEACDSSGRAHVIPLLAVRASSRSTLASAAWRGLSGGRDCGFKMLLLSACLADSGKSSTGEARSRSSSSDAAPLEELLHVPVCISLSASEALLCEAVSETDAAEFFM